LARDRGCKFDDRVEVGATMLLAAARCVTPDALIAGVWEGGVVKDLGRWVSHGCR